MFVFHFTEINLIVEHIDIHSMRKLLYVKLVTMHYASQDPWRRKPLNFLKPYLNPSCHFTFDLNLTWLLTVSASTQAFLLAPSKQLSKHGEIGNHGPENQPSFGEKGGNVPLHPTRQPSYSNHFPSQQTQIYIWQLGMV